MDGFCLVLFLFKSVIPQSHTEIRQPQIQRALTVGKAKGQELTQKK